MRALPMVAALGLGLVACPASDPTSAGVLVVGLQTEDFGALVARVHVVVKADGAVTTDETIANPGALTKEIRVTGVLGGRVEVALEGLGPSGDVAVSRRAATRLVAESPARLLRVRLDSRCLVSLGGVSGTAATCGADLTCSAGGCVSPEVPIEGLETYEVGWALAPPDICRPANHGPPEVILGSGQNDYATLVDGQVLPLERGPQGGHHVWIAVRMKNLRQSGSTTTIRSELEGDPSPVPPTAFVFSFDRDEGAFCKLWGLRYQVDAGAPDLTTGYKRFLGKRLKVTVKVVDTTGALAESTRTIQLADRLLCPDGTTTCT